MALMQSIAMINENRTIRVTFGDRHGGRSYRALVAPASLPADYEPVRCAPHISMYTALSPNRYYKDTFSLKMHRL